MQQLTFHCTRDKQKFQFKSGLSKIEAITLQDQYGDRSDFRTKIIISQQFDDFVNAINDHAKQCDGQIVVNPASYLIAD